MVPREEVLSFIIDVQDRNTQALRKFSTDMSTMLKASDEQLMKLKGSLAGATAEEKAFEDQAVRTAAAVSKTAGAHGNLAQAAPATATSTATATAALAAHSNALKTAGDRVKSTGAAISSAGGNLLRLSAPLALIGGESIKMASSFQSSMELVHTQAGASQHEVDSLTGKVLAMSLALGKSPQELSAGLFHIESAGYRGAKAMDVLKFATEGAKIGNTDLESVSNTLIATLGSGIKGIHGAGDAMGQLNAIVGQGNMKMVDLVGAISTGVLPKARTMGLSLKDVGAALDTLTIAGVPATAAATRLGMTFSLMLPHSSQALDAFRSIGLSQTQLAQDMRGPGGISAAVDDLKKHLDTTFPPGGGNKLSIDQQKSALNSYSQGLDKAGIVGKERAKDIDKFKRSLQQSGSAAVSQAQVMQAAFGGGRTSGTIMTLVQNSDELHKHLDILAHGDWAKNLQDAYAATERNTASKLESMKAAADVAGIKIGNSLTPIALPVLSSIAKELGAASHAFEKLPKGAKEAIAAVVGFGIVLGPVLKLVGTLTSSMGMLMRVGSHIPGLGGLGPAATRVQQAGPAGALGGLGMIVGETLTGKLVGSMENPVVVMMKPGALGGAGGLPGAAGKTAVGAEAATGAEAAAGAKAASVLAADAGQATALAADAGKAAGLLSKLGPALGGVAKFAGPIGGAIAAFQAADAFVSTHGNFTQRFSSAVHSLTFGLIGADPTNQAQRQQGTKRAAASFSKMSTDPSTGLLDTKGIAEYQQRIAGLQTQIKQVSSTKVFDPWTGQFKTDNAVLIDRQTQVQRLTSAFAKEQDAALKVVTATDHAAQGSAKWSNATAQLAAITPGLDKLTGKWQDAGALSAISYARGLELQGRIPVGATNKIIASLEARYPALGAYLQQQGATSMKLLGDQLRVNSVQKNATGLIDSLRLTFGWLPSAAQTAGASTQAKMLSAERELRNIIKHGTQAQRDAAIPILAQMVAEHGKYMGAMRKRAQDEWAAIAAAAAMGERQWEGVLRSLGSAEQQAAAGAQLLISGPTATRTKTLATLAGHAQGGYMHGVVPGSPHRDGTLALLSGREFIMTGPGQSTMERHAPGLLAHIDQTQAKHFAAGGFVSGASAPAPAPGGAPGARVLLPNPAAQLTPNLKKLPKQFAATGVDAMKKLATALSSQAPRKAGQTLIDQMQKDSDAHIKHLQSSTAASNVKLSTLMDPAAAAGMAPVVKGAVKTQVAVDASFDTMGKSAALSTHALGAGVQASLEATRQNAAASTAKMRSQVTGDFNVMQAGALGSIGQLRTGVATGASQVQSTLSGSSRQSQQIVTQNFAGLERGVGTAMVGSVNATGQGAKLIVEQLNQALSSLGAKKVPSVTAVGAGAVSAAVGASVPGHATGGRVPGAPGPDNVGLYHPGGGLRGIVAGGELLIGNRHTEARVDRMLAPYGTTLGAEVAGESRPHSAPRYATGGRIVTASDFGGPSDSSAYMHSTASGKIMDGSLVGYAELSDPPSSLNFSALGHLPMGTMLPVTYGGKTIKIPKVDVGAGGAPIAPASVRAIDLTQPAANQLGFPGLANVIVGNPAGINLAAGAGAGAAQVPQIPVPKVKGSGTIPAIVRAGLGKLAAAANAYAQAHAPVPTAGGAGVSSLGGGHPEPLTGPGQVQQMISEANAIASHNYNYEWGGGHGSVGVPSAGDGTHGSGSGVGFDCSGAVAAVLHAAGMVNSPMVSGDFMSWGDQGPGKDVSIFSCVPLDTRILTRRGWLSHDEVEVGDETLGLNPKTGASEWTKIRRVVHYEDAPIQRLSNRRFVVRATPNHRWLVESRRRGREGNKGSRRWMANGFKRADEMGKYQDRIITSAPVIDDGSRDIAPNVAALIGWLASDGYVWRNWPSGRVARAGITQSEKKYTAEIRSLLEAESVAHTEASRRWAADSAPVVEFRLTADSTQRLLLEAGVDAEPNLTAWVLSLSRAARRAFMEAVLLAEGNAEGIGKSGGRRKEIRARWSRFAQNTGELLDAMSVALHLEGVRPSTYQNENNSCAEVFLAEPRVAKLEITDLPAAPVWCVETTLGSWTMRQGEVITLTGNSPSHVYMELMGHYFGTSGQNPGGGANWIPSFPGEIGATTHPHGYALGGTVPAHGRRGIDWSKIKNALPFDGGDALLPGLAAGGRLPESAGSFKDGGAVTAHKPTVALFGENGPETAVFMPHNRPAASFARDWAKGSHHSSSHHAASSSPVVHYSYGYNPLTDQVEYHSTAEWQQIHAEAAKQRHDGAVVKQQQAAVKKTQAAALAAAKKAHAAALAAAKKARAAYLAAPVSMTLQDAGIAVGQIDETRKQQQALFGSTRAHAKLDLLGDLRDLSAAAWKKVMAALGTGLASATLDQTLALAARTANAIRAQAPAAQLAHSRHELRHQLRQSDRHARTLGEQHSDLVQKAAHEHGTQRTGTLEQAQGVRAHQKAEHQLAGHERSLLAITHQLPALTRHARALGEQHSDLLARAAHEHGKRREATLDHAQSVREAQRDALAKISHDRSALHLRPAGGGPRLAQIEDTIIAAGLKGLTSQLAVQQSAATHDQTIAGLLESAAPGQTVKSLGLSPMMLKASGLTARRAKALIGTDTGPAAYAEQVSYLTKTEIPAYQQDANHLQSLYRDALKTHNKKLQGALLNQLDAVTQAELKARSDVHVAMVAMIQATAQRFQDKADQAAGGLDLLKAIEDVPTGTSLQSLGLSPAVLRTLGVNPSTAPGLEGSSIGYLQGLQTTQGGTLTAAQLAQAKAGTEAQNTALRQQETPLAGELGYYQSQLPNLKGKDYNATVKTMQSLAGTIASLEGTIDSNNKALDGLTKATTANTAATDMLGGTLTYTYQNQTYAVGQSSSSASSLGPGGGL